MTVEGTAELTRLGVRLDRVRAPLAAVAVMALVIVSAGSVAGLYSTPEQIAEYVSLVNVSPNMAAVNSAMNGPGFGFDDPDIGVVLVNELAVWGAVAFALMAIFGVARHTRAEEDAERTEVLRSRMVGRHATLAAAGLTVGALVVAVGAMAFLGLLATGYAPVGSFALVCGFVAAGCVFGAVTAVAAQVAGTSRATIGFGVGALGAAYLLRAVGDMGDGTLSWLSPIGWVHRLRPFAGEQWWVLGLSAAVVVVCCVASVVLSDRRNLGSGMLPQRLGPPRAGWCSVRLLGLTARLQRGSIIGWCAGLAVLGVAYGWVGSDISQMFDDMPDLEQFIPTGAGSVTDSYLAYTMVLGAMLAGGFAVSSVLRMRAEESSGRAELLLARPLSRRSWALTHLTVTVGGSAVVMASYGLAIGLGISAALGDPGQLPRMLGAALGLVPAVLVLAGLAMLLVGAVPRVAAGAWVGLAVVVVIGLFGDLFSLPDPLRWVSPLEHLAMMPAEGFDAVGFVAVTAVALVLAGSGLLALRDRDLPA